MPSNADRNKKKKMAKKRSSQAVVGMPPSCLPVPMLDDVARHIEGLVKDLDAPVKIRQISDTKGKGAFATTNIECGKVLWTEAPLVTPLQHLANQKMTATCANCCGWLGTTADVAAWLVADRNRDGKVVTGQGLSASDKCVRCTEDCGFHYCSEQCRDTHWVAQHRLLCTGTGGLEPEQMSQGHALHRGSLLMFEQHAAQCNEALLLAARVVATILSVWEGNGRTAEALASAKAPFDIFQSPPWWEVSACKASSAKEAAEERKNMEDELRKSIKYLSLALLPCHRGMCDELFKIESFASIIGMFECNNISVEVECPLAKLLSGKRADSDEELSKLDPAVREKVEAMKSSLDKNCFTGAGLFSLVSTLNHSCEPNCSIEYDSEAVAHVRALRELAAGEELCISYIDTDADFDERRSQLSEYGFECDCPRCTTSAHEDCGSTPGGA